MDGNAEEHILELRAVGKAYAKADSAAVSDFNLAVTRGEFITFLGPSGSGKSTILNMIAGFIQPTSGEILLNGRSISSLPPYKRGLGMVFQNYSLFPHMSVWDNVAFPLVQRKTARPEIARRVAETLDLVGLGGFAKRSPRELSGGQQQRVALARAIVFDPPLILMDEPLGALDKNLRQRLQQEIKRLHQESGKTFVFVTHDQEEAMILSDRIVLLSEGEVRQTGTPDDLYRRPVSRFVAEFLGESNIFDGTLVGGEGAVSLDVPEGRIPLPAGAAPGGAPAGGEVAAMLRPEDLALSPAGTVPESWRVTLSEVSYLGSEIRATVTTDLKRSLLVRLPAEAARAGLTRGDEFDLTIRPDAVWMLPEQQRPNAPEEGKSE